MATKPRSIAVVLTSDANRGTIIATPEGSAPIVLCDDANTFAELAALCADPVNPTHVGSSSKFDFGRTVRDVMTALTAPDKAEGEG